MKAGDDQELGRGKQSEKELWGILSMEGPQAAVSEDRVEHLAHERLTDLAVVPREKPHTGAAAREPPRASPVIAEMRAFVSCMA